MITRPENLPEVEYYTEQEISQTIEQVAKMGAKHAAFHTARLSDGILHLLRKNGYTIWEGNRGWTEISW